MAVGGQKRRLNDREGRRPQKKPRISRQVDYHSSSENEEAKIPRPASAPPKSILKHSARLPEHMGEDKWLEAEEDGTRYKEVEKNTALNAAGVATGYDTSGSEEVEDGDDGGEDSDALSASGSEAAASSLGSSWTARTAKKRNDPDAFATSISKILGTKLSQPKRQDPILSRSKDTSATTEKLANFKLEQKARALLRTETKKSLERGRVKDLLALDNADVDTGALLEEEKRLKKTAQRGVVRLFNAVRAAQVKAEEATRHAREEGMVGIQKREERVNEMSKQGFLDLISKGRTA